jgi:hypothetical protein
LRNQSARTWLALRLVDSRGIPAIGARVTVRFADGRVVAHEHSAGSGYLSQSAPEIYIGLADAAPQRAEIRWPAGATQSVDLVGRSGRIVLVSPGDPQGSPRSRD